MLGVPKQEKFYGIAIPALPITRDVLLKDFMTFLQWEGFDINLLFSEVTILGVVRAYVQHPDQMPGNQGDLDPSVLTDIEQLLLKHGAK